MINLKTRVTVTFRFFTTVLAGFLTVAAPSYAVTDEDQLVQDQIYSELREGRVDTSDRKAVTWGGWIIPALTIYDQADKKKTGFQFYSITSKVWVQADFTDTFSVYVRGKDRYWDAYQRTNTPMAKSDNVAALDVATFQTNLMNKSLVITLGRKYFLEGTGLVLNGRGDGGQVDYHSRYVNAKAMALYTGLFPKEDNTYGISQKEVTDGSKRFFGGAEVSKKILNQNYYLFDIYQKDMNNAAGDYDSNYAGVGAENVFGNLDVKTEAVYESGKSYTESTKKTADVSAYAFQTSGTYYLDYVMHPALYLSYAFASGDSDRKSATGAFDNATGSDLGFLSFGVFSGGNALNPQLSNLHVGRVGFSFKPMDMVSSRRLNRMVLITKYSYYQKDKEKGPTSDAAANNSRGFVGQGVDVNLRWEIYSDLGFFAGYSLFIPGDAYNKDFGNRTLVLSGVNLKF